MVAGIPREQINSLVLAQKGQSVFEKTKSCSFEINISIVLLSAFPGSILLKRFCPLSALDSALGTF
jgi:hypothetical protein